MRHLFAIVAVTPLLLAGCSPDRPSTSPVVGRWMMADGTEQAFEGSAVSVASGLDRFIAAGRDGSALRLWTSDGIDKRWTVIPPNQIGSLDRPVNNVEVAVGTPGFVVIGQRQEVVDGGLAAWFSRDGQQWEAIESPAFHGGFLDISGLIWTGDRFLGVGDAVLPRGLDQSQVEPAEVDVVVISSPDGRTWVRNMDPALTADGGLRMHGIGRYGTEIVAVGHVDSEGATMLISDDGGNTWRQTRPKDLANATVRGVAESAAGLVLGGCTDGVDDGTNRFRAVVWIAADGPDGPMTEHRLVEDGPSSCVMAVVSSASDYTAVGYVGDDAAIWASEDGLDWRLVPVDGLDAVAGAWLTGIVSGPLGQVAVGVGRPGHPLGAAADARPIFLMKP